MSTFNKLATFLLVLGIAACSGDSLISPFESIVEGRGLVSSTAPVKMCQTITFDDLDPPVNHLDQAVESFDVALAGGFTVDVTVTPGGSLSQNLAYLYDTDVTGGPDPDLEAADTANVGKVLIIGHTNLAGQGDSPDGGTISLTGFPATGTTTIESYLALDQEPPPEESSILLLIDGVETGGSSGKGDGSVETVIPSSTPGITTSASFVFGTAPDVEPFVGNSGAVDEIEICHTPDPDNPGTGTPGFWQNHPDAWPIESFTFGSEGPVSKEAAIDYMQAPVRGDKSLNLFEHYIAARLNEALGNDVSCITPELDEAQDWLEMYFSGFTGSPVRANSPEWQNEGSALLDLLDAYNNGLLCAPSRDA